MDRFSEIEGVIIKERGEKWAEWRDLCVEAERRQKAGEMEMVVPIELILLARDIPRSIERFYSQLFTKTSECKVVKKAL